MNPRLSTSLKWTALPSEFADKVRKVFADNFKVEAEAGEFLVEGRIYPEEILMRIGYLEKGRLKQVNFEASSTYSKEAGNAFDKLYLCVDAIASMMEEAFEADEEIEFPLNWREYDFEGQPVFLQYSTVNTELEAEADRILGLADQALVKEEILEDDNRDAMEQAVVDSDLAKEIQKRIRKNFDLN